MEQSKNRNICDTVEELIIQQNITLLTEKDAAFMLEHLKSCKDCQLFQSRLAGIQQSMKIENSDSLSPKSEIHAALTNRLREVKQQNREPIFSSTWGQMRRLFEYRIPVYQGLLGFAACVVVFFIIQNFNSKSLSPESPNLSQPVETVQFNNVQIINDLQIVDDQKIGKNVSEDTLMTKYVFSVM